jgi:hypothetical protein
MKHDDAKADMKMDKAQDKQMIKSALGKHEKNMHQGMKPTKLAKGGKTNAQMKQLGRGLAKVANQKKSSFTYKKGA